jgi:CBS domain-containing protein
MASVESLGGTSRIPREETTGLTVGDVMIERPKTLPGDALVGDVRRAFANPSLRTVLLSDDGAFRGAIERDRLPPDAPDEELAAAFADTRPLTTTPATGMPEAIELLEGRVEPRLVVLDEDGVTLRGLLCFSRGADGFCVQTSAEERGDGSGGQERVAELRRLNAS